MSVAFQRYILGDSLSPDTTLGPVVRKEAADLIREHVRDAGRESHLSSCDISFALSERSRIVSRTRSNSAD